MNEVAEAAEPRPSLEQAPLKPDVLVRLKGWRTVLVGQFPDWRMPDGGWLDEMLADAIHEIERLRRELVELKPEEGR